MPTSVPNPYPVGVTAYPAASRVPFPSMSGTTLDGRRLAVADLRGHVVIINIWASWCEPCKSESPALVAAAKSTTGRGVRFVGIDEADQAPAALQFLRAIGSTYPHLVDTDGRLLGQMATLAAPGGSGHARPRPAGTRGGPGDRTGDRAPDPGPDRGRRRGLTAVMNPRALMIGLQEISS